MAKSTRSICALMLALCMLAGAVPAFAQSQAGSGQIAGTVTDNAGAAITNATVKATNTQTGLERTVTTGDEGLYKLVLLPPGIYNVTGEAAGFAATTVNNVEVTVGRTIDVNIVMGASGVQEVVNVTAGAIQVQTTRSEADAVVNERAINNLPINGRRFQDFVTLTPTAQVDPSRGQISLSGQRGINSNINVDGVDYNQPFFGGIRGGERSNTAFTIPQESIKEFQVVAAGYSAEFGRSTGGIVNAVTKSGTNDYHGSAFYLVRPKDTARKNLFFNTLEQQVNSLLAATPGSTERDIKPSPTQQQFGGSFGGPIKRDKLFFFGALELQRVRQDREVFFDALNGVTPGPNVNEALTFFQSLQQPFKQTNDAIGLLGRVDYEINTNHRTNIRYSYSRNNAENANARGNAIFPNTTSALSNNGTEKDRTNTVVGQLASFFSTTMVNEFRGQYSREDRPRESNSTAPTVTSSIGAYGAVNFLPTTQFDWRAQVADSVTWTRGSHTIKFGGEYNHVFVDQLFGFNQFGAYALSTATSAQVTLDQFSFSPGFVPPAGTTTVLNRLDAGGIFYNRQIGNRQASYTSNELAFFGQDSWRVRPNLTLNYGLRWEGQYNPDPEANNSFLIDQIKGFRFPSGHVVDPTRIPDDTKQFGPRFGFAWDPWSDSKTVVRGYTGIYYARTPLLIFAAPFNNFRDPAGDLSASLPFSTGPLAVGNPLKNCTTLYCQLNLIGINLNNFALDALPNVTPEQIQQVAQALGLPFSPFQGVQPILMAPDFKNPKSYQYGIGVERQVSRGLTLGADFNYVHTVRLQRNRDLNLPLPLASISGINPNQVDVAQRPFFGLVGNTSSATPADLRYSPRSRPIASLGSIQQRESTGKSLYRALTVRAKFQRTWGQFNAFYTLSKSLADDDNERDAGGVLFENAFNLEPEYGLSRLDRKHQFVANPVFFFPHGFDFSSAIRLRSGRPIDARLGFDANEDRNNTDRPFQAPGIPFERNAFRNRPLYDVDTRVQKRFSLGETRRLLLTWEVFNIFNLQNIEINDNSGTNNGVTNYCVAVGGSIPRNCGFGAPTNPNFLQLVDRNPASRTVGKELLTNNPGQPFQMQFGARFQF